MLLFPPPLPPPLIPHPRVREPLVRLARRLRELLRRVLQVRLEVPEGVRLEQGREGALAGRVERGRERFVGWELVLLAMPVTVVSSR